jgi:hypothetical protein
MDAHGEAVERRYADRARTASRSGGPRCGSADSDRARGDASPFDHSRPVEARPFPLPSTRRHRDPNDRLNAPLPPNSGACRRCPKGGTSCPTSTWRCFALRPHSRRAREGLCIASDPRAWGYANVGVRQRGDAPAWGRAGVGRAKVGTCQREGSHVGARQTSQWLKLRRARATLMTLYGINHPTTRRSQR